VFAALIEPAPVPVAAAVAPVVATVGLVVAPLAGWEIAGPAALPVAAH
jgi:hypothetical protein